MADFIVGQRTAPQARVQLQPRAPHSAPDISVGAKTTATVNPLDGPKVTVTAESDVTQHQQTEFRPMTVDDYYRELTQEHPRTSASASSATGNTVAESTTTTANTPESVEEGALKGIGKGLGHYFLFRDTNLGNLHNTVAAPAVLFAAERLTRNGSGILKGINIAAKVATAVTATMSTVNTVKNVNELGDAIARNDARATQENMQDLTENALGSVGMIFAGKHMFAENLKKFKSTPPKSLDDQLKDAQKQHQIDMLALRKQAFQEKMARSDMLGSAKSYSLRTKAQGTFNMKTGFGKAARVKANGQSYAARMKADAQVKIAHAQTGILNATAKKVRDGTVVPTVNVTNIPTMP